MNKISLSPTQLVLALLLPLLFVSCSKKEEKEAEELAELMELVDLLA
jgi:hypothetical protein